MRTLQYLTELLEFPSVSSESNSRITDFVQEQLQQLSMTVERIDYRDELGVTKSCVLGRRGPAGCGLAYFAHTDVVPVASWAYPHSGPWQPHVTGERVVARGACDMKGSMACMLAALENVQAAPLSAPVYFIATADEEVGMRGARELVARSRLYREIVEQQTRAIIGEPTLLEVVYAHKGSCGMHVTAHGRAAHSSTGLGLNANLAMIPFLAGLKDIYEQMESAAEWRDARFSPPTPTMNMTVNDHNSAVNITSPRADTHIYFRPMPGQNTQAVVSEIRQLAERCGLQFELKLSGSPLYTDPGSPFIRELLQLTGRPEARTVAYGTDGAIYTELRQVAVLGPGSIEQAHTDDEWISLEQLQRGTDLYERLIRQWCVAGG